MPGESCHTGAPWALQAWADLGQVRRCEVAGKGSGVEQPAGARTLNQEVLFVYTYAVLRTV